jgi:hypothetical protein
LANGAGSGIAARPGHVNTDLFMMPADHADKLSDEKTLLPGALLTELHEAALKFAGSVRRARAEVEAVAGSRPGRLAPALRALARIDTVLRRPLRLALMGEFNSGKSTLANLLIGNAPLPTLQLSNTRIPTLIHYHPEPVVTAVLEGGRTVPLTLEKPRAPDDTLRIQVGMPMPHLAACEFVDFPGFSDPWLSYGAAEIGRHPIDAAIWCTFSTQAWKESESTAWRMLPRGIRRSSILAVTSKDLLTEEQTEKVMARLTRAAPEFVARLAISAVNARKAIGAAGTVEDASLWQGSGADDLYGVLRRLLSAIRRRRLEKAKMMTGRIAGAAVARL